MPTPKLDNDLAHACVSLGLHPPFSLESAKARYRELAKLYHPDVGTIKDHTRFAEISKAYELITQQHPRLASAKVGLVSDTGVAASQLGDLLDQLHETKARNVTTERKLHQIIQENEALRNYAKSSRKFNTRMIAGIALIVACGLILGFLAGMFWTAKPNTYPLEPVSYHSEFTLPAMQSVPTDKLGVFANLSFKSPIITSITLESGEVRLRSKTAQLLTTPTLTSPNLSIENISINVNVSQTTSPTAI